MFLCLYGNGTPLRILLRCAIAAWYCYPRVLISDVPLCAGFNRAKYLHHGSITESSRPTLSRILLSFSPGECRPSQTPAAMIPNSDWLFYSIAFVSGRKSPRAKVSESANSMLRVDDCPVLPYALFLWSVPDPGSLSRCDQTSRTYFLLVRILTSHTCTGTVRYRSFKLRKKCYRFDELASIHNE